MAGIADVYARKTTRLNDALVCVSFSCGGEGDALDAWIQRASDQAVPRELRVFATGLRSDYQAVKAALTTDWSNGQVEGQVNRSKLIKRQMHGRAKFDLLRKRVLHTG